MKYIYILNEQRMKDKQIAWILALFLWWLWIHKFYLWSWILGLIYLLFSWTWLPSLISFIEWILFFIMSKEEFDERYNWIEPKKEKKTKKQLEKEQAEDDMFRKYFLIWLWFVMLLIILWIIYLWVFAEHKTF